MWIEVSVTPWSVAPLALPGPHGVGRVPNLVTVAAAAALPLATVVTMAVEPSSARASSTLTAGDLLNHRIIFPPCLTGATSGDQNTDRRTRSGPPGPPQPTL